MARKKRRGPNKAPIRRMKHGGKTIERKGVPRGGIVNTPAHQNRLGPGQSVNLNSYGYGISTQFPSLSNIPYEFPIDVLIRKFQSSGKKIPQELRSAQQQYNIQIQEYQKFKKEYDNMLTSGQVIGDIGDVDLDCGAYCMGYEHDYACTSGTVTGMLPYCDCGCCIATCISGLACGTGPGGSWSEDDADNAFWDMWDGNFNIFDTVWHCSCYTCDMLYDLCMYNCYHNMGGSWKGGNIGGGSG